MFGYVKVHSDELRVREFEFYKGTYCGLCRAMGKCTGQCSRLTLSYDFVFLALVRLLLTPEDIRFKRKRCLVHPLKKRNSMERNTVLDYCADACAILNYRKILDDLSDERGMKKLRARLVLPSVAHARKKALKRSPCLSQLDEKTEKHLQDLSVAEGSVTSGVDSPAECFGRLLGDIFAFGLEGGNAKIAFGIGFAVGKWIYIADALDDLDDDLKKERYNPILKLFSGKAPTEEEANAIALSVKNHLLGGEAAFDLITVPEGSEAIAEIVANILFLGLDEKMKYITEKHYKENKQDGKELPND